MGAAVASQPIGSVRLEGVDPGEFRAALEAALAAADADETIGPVLTAAGLRLRLSFPDADMALNIAALDQEGRLRWSFGRVDWEPKLVLEMDCGVANRYLQGVDSLAIAIARGKVRVRGSARTALLYLPATKLLASPYRRAVDERFPALVAAASARD